MTRSILRSRILALVSPGFVAAAALACSWQDPSDDPRGTGGTTGGTGVGGSGGADGTGIGEAGPDGAVIEKIRICLTPAEVRSICSGDNDACLADGGIWDREAGSFSCPDTISMFYSCKVYEGPPTRENDSCCYQTLAQIPPYCGRPFFVEGEARVAAVTRRRDWRSDRARVQAAIDMATREALALAWLEDARLEHASIASFARFTLELLALGAPSELVADAQRAASDEVDHARRCFTLASDYAGETLGPGSLSTGGFVLRSNLADVAASAVREGCIGETLAAVRAGMQLAHASEPRVRDTLNVIANDEARHAELAWRFVRWAMETGGTEVSAAIAHAFESALSEVAEEQHSLGPVDLPAWRSHGRLSPPEESACRRQAVREVIEPCRRAMLLDSRPLAHVLEVADRPHIR